MTALLTENLPLIAAALGGVKTLRTLIRDLAVRGKLIATSTWPSQPSTLGRVATLQNGYAFKSEWFAPRGVRLLRNANVSHGVMCWDDVVYLPEQQASEFERFQLNEGDIVLSLDRPFITSGTKVARVRKLELPCLLLQRVGRFQLNPEMISGDYLFLWINSPHFTSQIDPGRSNGVPHISSKQVEAAEIYVPPLAEQRRIVAKVDELMALCDRLEAQQVDAEAAHATLVKTLLDTLTQSQNADDFAANWQRLGQHFDTIFTTEASLDALKQALLQLAVMGKLVRQDASDEPIRLTLGLDRAQQLARKRGRPKKADASDTDLDGGLIPETWIVEPLVALVDPQNPISYGVLVPGHEVADGVPFVRVQDLFMNNHPARPNKSISPDVEKSYARTRLKGGEILVCVVGSIGKIGVAPAHWAGANIARAIARIIPIESVSRDYMLLVLRGPAAQQFFTGTTRTVAQPTLNISQIENTPIPLPPLAEQRRIVAKVDELMAQCDDLKARLAESRTVQGQLATALVERVVAA